MKKLLLFISCFGALPFVHAQSLEQVVIGGAGYSSITAANSTLSWTLGEVITTTASSGTATLTQGFHQPITINPLSSNYLEKDLRLSVYPNPTTEHITIQKEQEEILKAQLINMLGQVIATYDLEDYSNQISLYDLPAATYLLQIRTKENRAIQSFKIQKTQ